MGDSVFFQAFTWGEHCVYMGQSLFLSLFTWGNALGALLGGLRSVLVGLGRSWAENNANRHVNSSKYLHGGKLLGDLRAVSKHLGSVLGRSWALLGRSWVVFGLSWAVLRRSWAGLGVLLGGLGSLLGGFGAVIGGLGWS